MKSTIRYSTFATVVTAAVFIVMYVACIATLHQTALFVTMLSLYVILIVAGLLFGAAYVRADGEHVVLGSILRRKKIAVRDIESIEPFKPTMGAVRIIGSGGFMGYWGIFKEGDIGRYRAFYGKASDCFLIRMKNGDRYVLGCDNPLAMVDHIKGLMR